MPDQPDETLPGPTEGDLGTADLDHAGRVTPLARIPSGELLAGRYRIETFIAEGGMGQVYRATDLELGVPIALKTIRAEVASDPAALRRFKQEVLLARSVSHPNVCRIFDIGRDDSRATSYLTMEYLEGETLSARIRRQGPFAPREGLALVRQLAEGLDSAHRAGIVHRDFKSPNVMLVPTPEGSRAVITDFGLATTLDRVPHPTSRTLGVGLSAAGDAERTEAFGIPEVGGVGAHDPITRGIVGTPAYMAPEQVTGARVGPPSDLYALGVVLFEMVTGSLPFQGTTPLEIARARVEQEPPLPSSIASVDPRWDATIRKLLSRDPDERHASGRDVVIALEGGTVRAEKANFALPVERDVFIGRTEELGVLHQRFGLGGETPLDGALAAAPAAGSAGFTPVAPVDPSGWAGTARCVSLLGPGGTGKSRLAIHFGWQALPRFPGGVWFCDLSDAHSLEGVVAAVARGLNLVLGSADPIQRIAESLAERGPCLVILDNFEQIVEHAPDTLARWLRDCPGVRFLVTTRERLRLDDEEVLALEPLDPKQEGVALFGIRAAGHRPGFRVDDANRPAVERIVAHLDGMPLAIELAAARLRMLSLAQLEKRLENRFQILSGGKRGRQSTLRTTLDWSWDLLTPWERSAVAQASVFEGGFSLEAAEEVLDLSSHHEAPPVIDVLQSLIDKSWIRARVALDAPRFGAYATIQEYASEKFGQGEERVAAEIRHGQHFGAMTSRDPNDATANRESWRALRRIDLDNLIAACRRAIARRDGRTATDNYVEAATVLKDRGPLATAWQLGEDILAIVEEPVDRARALAALGASELVGGLVERSLAHYQESLAYYDAAGDRKNSCVVRANLGILHCMAGRMEEARSLCEAALQAVRTGAHPNLEGKILGTLGIIALDLGRFEEARTKLEEAIVAHRRAGDRLQEGTVRGNLSSLHREQGRLDDAEREAEAAIAIHREVGNRRTEGTMLGNLGNIHLQAGRPERALASYEAALEANREVGDISGEAVSLRGMCRILLVLGRVVEARARFVELEEVQRRVGDPLEQGVLLGCLAELLWAEGAPASEVRSAFAGSLELLRDPSPRTYGETLCRAGRYELEQNDRERARAFLSQAESLLQEAGDQQISDLSRAVETLRQAFLE